jgi:hypothetical protein
MTVFGLLSAILLLFVSSVQSQAKSLVYNGTFNVVTPQGIPDGWYSSGHRDIIQQFSVDDDTKGNHIARLLCTKYVPGTPSSHAMISQLRRITLKKGEWYRLSFRARGDVLSGNVYVSIQETRGWRNAGLIYSFTPFEDWKKFDVTFRAAIDVEQTNSRLAFYFLSTGILYLDDVVLENYPGQQRQWFPQISVEGVVNAVPNSSFECGTAEWGSLSVGRRYSWMEGLFNLFGRCDNTTSFNGTCSLKTEFSKNKPVLLHTVYPVPATLHISDNLVGYNGWFKVNPGERYVFSAYVKADRPGIPVRITILHADGGHWSPRVHTVTTEWVRIEESFVARQPFVTCCVGMSFEENGSSEGTLWIDAIQFERGTKATQYRTREEAEARLETGNVGNIFTNPASGLIFQLLAYNSTDSPKILRGRLTATDFMEQVIWQEEVKLSLPAGKSVQQIYRNILKERQGFFRLRWQPERGLEQSIRCAVIEPVDPGDTMFGFNHTFPTDFLFPLCNIAGLRWWRDWCVSWQNVQAEPGPFDFNLTDIQINRTLYLGGRPLVLFPYPSSMWATECRDAQLSSLKERLAAGLINESRFNQVLTSFKPTKMEDFEEYVKATVMHYHNRIKHFEVLNEPLYTYYSLPAGYGYTMTDYLEMLRIAYQTAKNVDPGCTIIGGIGCGPSSNYAASFIEEGGLQWCDVINWHIYPGRERAEFLEELFKMRLEQMKERNETKPIWITEFGLYADDDPLYTPFTFGDTIVTFAMRPDELTASADLVQLIAMMVANGVKKVFYHAGICQSVYASSAGNIFFEYGGVPRKMYAAQTVLARMFSPDMTFIRRWNEPDWLVAYEFHSRGQTLVVLWTRRTDAPSINIPEGLHAVDLMGNFLPVRTITPSEIPVYFIGKHKEQ